jgi:hypothetical protein
MEEKRAGKAIGAKQARALLEQVGGKRDAGLEARYPAGARHQVYLLEDARVIDLFLKSARIYESKEQFLLDRK